MLAPVDLHPGDAAARDALALHLRAIRISADVPQHRLAARLGVTQRQVAKLEQQRSWCTRIVQGWARALDHRLILDIRGLVVPDDGDGLAEIYDRQRPTNPTEQDQLALRRVVNDLTRIRRHKMSAYRLGRIVGRSESAVLQREESPDGALLATVQQTARALGGRLDVGLRSVEVPCAAV